MKTRQDLRSEIHKALANFYQDLDFVKDGDRAGVDYIYSIHTTIITHKCEEYFNFERESTTSPIGDTGRFAKMFDEKTNNKLCYGLYALIAVMVVAWIINFILI